ncbi:hypothetical protein B0H14DRAFT_2636391 [Mycena olivaceomarginata]|nr:hypothetical protein B0H14DRAFT_2636391 [Mycena olivaceomarginata]
MPMADKLGWWTGKSVLVTETTFGCAQKDSSLSESLGRLIGVSGQVDRRYYGLLELMRQSYFCDPVLILFFKPFETLAILSITVGITLAREAFALEVQSTFVWARNAHGEVDIHLPLLDGNRIEPWLAEIDNNWISHFREHQVIRTNSAVPNAGFVDALHNGNKSIAGTAGEQPEGVMEKRCTHRCAGVRKDSGRRSSGFSAAAVTHEERGRAVEHRTLLWICDRKLKAEGFGIMILSCARRPASS